MFRAACFVLALLVARAASAVECRDVAATGGNYTVCRVEPHETLRVFHSNARGVPYETFHALRDALKLQNLGLSFAMNAGMFHASKNAVGLLVTGGREVAPVNRSDGTGNFFLRPNGVFFVDADGPRVLATEDFRNLSPREATQSGPMLVHRGLIPDTLQFRAAAPSRRVRIAVSRCDPLRRGSVPRRRDLACLRASGRPHEEWRSVRADDRRRRAAHTRKVNDMYDLCVSPGRKMLLGKFAWLGASGKFSGSRQIACQPGYAVVRWYAP